VGQLLADNFTFQTALMRDTYMLPIAPTTCSGIRARCINSMFAATYNFNNIGPQKLFANVSDFCLNSFTRNSVSNKNHLAVVSSNAKSTISYFVDLQVNYITDPYNVSFSHC
jgi:hypothetical protein